MPAEEMSGSSVCLEVRALISSQDVSTRDQFFVCDLDIPFTHSGPTLLSVLYLCPSFDLLNNSLHWPISKK